MAAPTIPIASLPTEVSAEAAVEVAYGGDLEWLVEKLTKGLSVLVECEKQLTNYLYRALRQRLRGHASGKRLRLISGHVAADPAAAGPVGPQPPLMQRLLAQIQDAALGGDAAQVVVIPHLDVLTTTTRSGLSGETREAVALLYENQSLTILAFKDPAFELPKVIENLFAARRSLVGLPRERLGALITQREARKFAVDQFNPFMLYKYLSGVNAVRCRQILSHFADRVDFNPALPGAAEAILREIRQMTLSADLELPNVSLEADIGGYADVKKRLREEILELLQRKDRSADAESIRHIEEIVPKGIIFHGPPGTGKTFFAKAMATALDATIQIVSGPELKSRWVGESEENLRRVFAQARKAAPAIIVFDELDSFAAARGTFVGSGVEHSMVNQLLTEMDGFRKEEMVFVVGTTNFVESLDAALLRPGRFELAIEIPHPTEDDRRAILELYLRRFALKMEPPVLDYLVQRTGGWADERRGTLYTGDHLNAVCRALKREELRRGSGPLPITREVVEEALGARKRPSPRLQEQEQRTVAVHEAGHAVLAYVLPHCPTIEKVSIASDREEALGYVMQSVRKNRYVTTEAELADDICVALGGRLAERLLLGTASVGAHSDLQRATEVARLMVEELGMAPRIGPRAFPRGEGVLGSTGERRGISEASAALIDEEISRILLEQEERARRLLAEHRGAVEALRDLLLEKKSAGLEDMRRLFAGQEFKA